MQMINGANALRINNNSKVQEFIVDNKEYLDKYSNLQQTQNTTTENCYLKYVPQNIEALIKDLVGLRLTKALAIENIKKYGYEIEIEYILNSLGFSYKTKNKDKIKVNESVKKQAEIFSVIFDTTRDCFVRIRNNSTKEYRAYPITALTDPYRLQAILKSKYFSNMNDMMYSLNTYNNMYKGTDESLFSIHLIAIDVDFNTKLFTVQEALGKLEALYETAIPTPSMVEYGHRIRLLYKLECVPCTDKSKKVVRLVTQAIADKIEGLGASGQASTTSARIVGTINSKNGSTIDMKLIKAEPYRLRDLQNSLLSNKEWLEKIKKFSKKSKVVNFTNSYALNLARIGDLERIQSIREKDCRETLCYLYRNYCLLAHMSKEEAKNAMLMFNNNFSNPLRPNEAEQDTRALERKQYLHHGYTIIRLLDISPEEEKKLNLTVTMSQTENKRRDNEANKKKYRAKVGKDINISKNDELDIVREKIKSLRLKGLKNKEIMQTLGITSTTTFERHIQCLKKKGLI